MASLEGAKGGEVALVVEGEFQGGNILWIAMREVGEVAFADVRAVAVRLAEVDRLIDFVVSRGPGSAGHVYVHTMKHKIGMSRKQFTINRGDTYLHFRGQKPA